VYERAVGLYASLVDVNAYDQPGVEAGKKAAARVLELQGKVLTALGEAGMEGLDAQQVAGKVGAPADVETIYLLLERLGVDSTHRVTQVNLGSEAPKATGGTHPGAKFRRM